MTAHDPAWAFGRLDLPEDASPRQVRRAFRRLALVEHPDLNPGDPAADARFAELLDAYRLASGQPAMRRHRPSPPPPAPFCCPACGDGFTHRGICDRCDVAAVRRDEAGPPHVDPRVEAYEARLERAPKIVLPRWVEVLPLGPLLGASFLFGGAFFWWLGPLAPAALSAGFGAYLIGLAAWRSLAPVNDVSSEFPSGHQ